jgi:hypothetical protein
MPDAGAKGLLLSLKIQKDGSDREDFLFGEFWIDRERETVLTQPFGDGEMALFVTEMRVGLLQVNRHRIVHATVGGILERLPGFKLLAQSVFVTATV